MSRIIVAIPAELEAPGEERLFRLDVAGDPRSLRVTRSPLPGGGFSFIARDITDELKAQQSLRQSEERLQLAFHAASMGWWEWDIASGAVRWSESLERLVGLDPGSFGGSRADYLTYVHPDDREAVEEATPRVLAGEQRELMHRIVTPDGSMRWLEVKGRVIRDSRGEPRGMIGVAFDITERKRLESELAHTQKTEAVGRLAAGIAHDFNNLMSAVIGFSELALDRMTDDDPSRSHLEQVANAGQRAAKMSAQLLAFSRKQALEPAPVDLSEVVTGFEKLVERVIGEDVLLAVLTDPQRGTIYADRGQLEQVLMNLVVNARDAMPAGGRLTIRTTNAELDEATAMAKGVRPGAYARLSVSDTGVGIDEQTRDRIFEPFFTTKDPGKGTGLGLATILGIVKQAGGDISVSSTLGAGTTFDIYLPQSDQPAEINALADIDDAPSGGSETILLVEDSESMRTLERVVLEEYGYQVLEADTVHHALELARSHKGRIDLLLTDIVMPHLNGPQLAKRLLRIRPETKVLYASGYAQDDIAHHGLDREAALLPKPVTPEMLARTVRETLDARAEANAALVP